MFIPGQWAAAFINSLEREGAEIEDGIETLKVLSSWINSLPGVSGSGAEKLEALIRQGMKKTGNSSRAREVAVRFLVLMVKKNTIRHIDLVIDKMRKLLDKKRGVVSASVEYAMPKDAADEERIKEAIKKRTGAARVDLSGRVNPELIGGYRLRIGDEIIDASIRSQLLQMETCLAGDGGN
jgi:F-type H+-transporting ATPase subunit delta